MLSYLSTCANKHLHFEVIFRKANDQEHQFRSKPNDPKLGKRGTRVCFNTLLSEGWFHFSDKALRALILYSDKQKQKQAETNLVLFPIESQEPFVYVPLRIAKANPSRLDQRGSNNKFGISKKNEQYIHSTEGRGWGKSGMH